MLSQNQVKHVTSLKIKKFREENHQFIAEGHKLVMDLVSSDFRISGIYASADWIVSNLSVIRAKDIPVFETLPREMDRISALSTPSPVLAVVNYPGPVVDPASRIPDPGTSLLLALDDIRDPGNLGTIIRVADWFGVDAVLCSENCVDLYNPKVVQATMGSIARVTVLRCDLVSVISTVSAEVQRAGAGKVLPVYGTFLEGDPLFSQSLEEYGIIVIGNESRGVSSGLAALITSKLYIPSYGISELGKAESLNASIATAIICAEFRRNKISGTPGR